MKGKNMNNKEKRVLRKLYQMDLLELDNWKADNPASSFSDEFIEEVGQLTESLECEAQALREENMIYYRQEDRISDDPEIR